MKVSICFLFIVGITATITSAAVPDEVVLSRARRDLDTDLQDFVDLLPLFKIVKIVRRYVAMDEEVQAVVGYLKSNNFQNLISQLIAVPEVTELISYIENAGVDVQAVFGTLARFVTLVSSGSSSSEETEDTTTGGMAGLISDIATVLPVDELRALFVEKLETSENFAKLVAALTSDEFVTLIYEVVQSEEYQAIIEESRVDIASLFNLFKPLIGIQE